MMADSSLKFTTIELNLQEMQDMAEFIDGYAVSRGMSMAELDCLVISALSYLHAARAVDNFKEEIEHATCDLSNGNPIRKPS